MFFRYGFVFVVGSESPKQGEKQEYGRRIAAYSRMNQEYRGGA